MPTNTSQNAMTTNTLRKKKESAHKYPGTRVANLQPNKIFRRLWLQVKSLSRRAIDQLLGQQRRGATEERQGSIDRNSTGEKDKRVELSFHNMKGKESSCFLSEAT